MNKLHATAGFEAVVGGIGFVFQNPRLWGYALVPAGWLVVLCCGLGGLGIWAGWWASGALLGTDLSIWGQVGGWLLTIVLWAAAVLIALLLALVLAQPLSGFALETIARAQEQALSGYTTPAVSLSAALTASALVALSTLVVGVGAFGGLWLISFLFPPAVAITVPLKFLVGAWLLAWNFVDYPLTLHEVRFQSRLRWVARNFGAFTMFGLVWAALLIVPGVFFLILPLGVAGATRLVVADDQACAIRRD